MVVIEWEEHFPKIVEKLEQSDIWKIIDYGKEIHITGSYLKADKYKEFSFKYPSSYKAKFKSYFAKYEWVSEEWRADQFTGITFIKYSKICENKAFSNYQFMSQRQKVVFKKILHGDEENEYTILNNKVSYIN